VGLNGPNLPVCEPSEACKENELFKKKVLYSTGCFYELTKWMIVFLVLLSWIHFFVVTIFIVDGISMEPNFHNGQYIMVDRFHYLFGTPQRGDVVVLKFPGDPDHKKYIKRIIGIPGDHLTIKNGLVYVNNRLLKENYIPASFKTLPNVNRLLSTNEYFLMGDNRPNSSDSRIWGIAEKRYLIGKAWIVLYPNLQVIKSEEY
jgi:signal peptidase I